MKNWEMILLHVNDSIRKAMLKIDQSALRFAVVVDSKNTLLGTVTDGDIRRALIKGKELHDNLSGVMNIDPYFVSNDISNEAVLEELKSRRYLAVPVVENRKVIGIHTIDSLTKSSSYENPVFLMAGGFGTRLKPLTDNCPKPLLNVGSKPILEIVIERFIKAGFRNFYISTHYLPEMIRDHFGNGEKWGANINYVHENLPLGTGGALGLLPSDLPDLPIIMCNGDVLTSIDLQKLLEFHNRNPAIATMCVREYDYQIPFGVVEADGINITQMTEKPTYNYHVNAGIYVIERRLLDTLEKNQVIDMPTLLETQLAERVNMHIFHDYWLDIGRMDDFKKAQRDIETLEL